MPFQLGQRSLAYSVHVDPVLMNVVRGAIARSTVDFGMTEGQSRTVAEQQEKVRRGVSRVRPGPGARHMIQPDGYSKAVDLVPWIDGRFQWGDGNWRVRRADGVVVDAFFEIAAAMVGAARDAGVRLRWGAVWDRNTDTLPTSPAGLRAELEAYKVRHAGPDFLDGPHWELPL